METTAQLIIICLSNPLYSAEEKRDWLKSLPSFAEAIENEVPTDFSHLPHLRQIRITLDTGRVLIYPY